MRSLSVTRCGRRARSSPGPSERGSAGGSEQDQRQGTAKRRQRSAAGRRMSNRSRLIVPLSAGNSPERTRGREAADRSKHLLEGQMSRTLDREVISTRQQKIADLASKAPQMVLNTLAHHIDLMWLEEAYRRTRKDGAVGVDGVTAAAYEQQLHANLSDLLERFKSGRYRAPPVRRVHIPKDGTKKTRPIGIPTLEDKVLQRAVLMALEPSLRAGLSGLLLRFPAGPQPAPSARSALARTDEHRWRLGDRSRHPAFFDSMDRTPSRRLSRPTGA